MLKACISPDMKNENAFLCFSYGKFPFNANVTLKCQSTNEALWEPDFLLYKMMIPCYTLFISILLDCWKSKDQTQMIQYIFTNSTNIKQLQEWSVVILSPVRWPTTVTESLSCVQLFATPWTAACQPPPFSTISQSLLKFMSRPTIRYIQSISKYPNSSLKYNLLFKEFEQHYLCLNRSFISLNNKTISAYTPQMYFYLIAHKLKVFAYIFAWQF